MFILLFSAVNVHGDLFVRSANYTSRKDCVMVVCFHIKLQRPSSVAIVRQRKEIGFMIICKPPALTGMGTQGHAGLYQFRMTLARVLISNWNAGITTSNH